jgi:hypothetical protein
LVTVEGAGHGFTPKQNKAEQGGHGPGPDGMAREASCREVTERASGAAGRRGSPGPPFSPPRTAPYSSRIM